MKNGLVMKSDNTRNQNQTGICRKKHTESEMRKLSSAVEQAADIIFITDSNGIIEYANPAFERITGYRTDEVIGKKPSIMKSGEMSGEYYIKVWSTILSGNPIHDEVKNRRKDGSIFYYDQTITPLKNENGEITNFISTGTDITARKAAEKALIESEERYNLAITGTDAGIWDWIDINGNSEWWSPRFYELLGYSQGEVEPTLENFSGLLHPDDRDRTFDLVNRHFKDNIPFTIEYRLKTKTGDYKWFLGSGMVKRDNAGNPVRMVGSIIDINDKRMAENLLKESELRFRAIFDQTFQLIGLLEPDGTLIEANMTALDFGGFRAEDVRGKKFWDAPWWSWSESSIDKLKEAITLSSSGKFVRYETELMGADGRIIFIDFSIKPIRDSNGNIVLLIPEGRDITDKRNMEIALRTSEEQMRIFIKHTPAAVAMFDNRMRYMAASLRWYHDYNIDGREIIGKSHYEIFPEIEGMPHWKKIHQRCLNGESISNEKDMFSRSDGKTDWVRWDIHPWRTNDGDVGGIIMFTEVITERVENEIKINNEREKAQRYLDIAGNIFVVINREQNVELINQKGCEITGYPEEEIIGRNWFDLILPEDKRETAKLIFKSLMTGELETKKYSESIIVSRNGEQKIIAWHNTVIRDANDMITSTLSSGIDITEKKQAEKNLLKLNMELEERVSIRTMELKQALEALRKNEQRAMLLKEVASAANAASSADDAFSISLSKICSYTGWPVGHVYVLSDKSGRLISSQIWFINDEKKYSAIKNISALHEFESGQGLPGRILKSGKPEWIEDIKKDKNFIRSGSGIDLGVNTAFGFPVIVKGNVEAVLEFFTDRAEDSDNDLLIILEQISQQLGYVVERKRVEQALRESETKFRTIFNENIHFLLGFVSTEGVLLDINNAALSFSGTSREDVINKPFRNGPWWADSPEDRLKLDNAIKSATKGHTVSFEATHRDYQDKIHYIDFSLTPIKNQKGEIEYLIPSGFDITERKRVLKEREILLSEMGKRVKELNCLYKISDSIQKNQNIDDIFEYSANILPLSWQYPDETAARIEYGGKKYFSDQFQQSEWRLTSPILIDGIESGLVEVFYTAEKPLEDEGPFLSEERNLIDGISHLFSLMIKKKIIQDDLERARAEAESASRAKSEFLANMSHEIRTPMNAIIGMNYMLKKTDLKPKQRDYVYKIDMSSKTLLGIINDILDLSKIEAGKLELENINFSLHDIFVNLSNMVGFLAQEKGLELIISIDDGIPMELKGDPLRLGQILLNLTNNAVKFTDHGEIIIEANAENITEKKVKIRFSVKDTGIGMHPHEKEKLFQPFIQADTSTTRKYGGTGLGLAICNRLAELMGGTIGVESEYGRGSTFYFITEFELPGRIKKRNTLPDEFKNRRVLVADDNRTSCRVLASYLEKLSFNTVTVYSGDEALAEIEKVSRKNEEPFAFVFLDWDMPGNNGIETAQMIIKSHRLKQRPKIIIVTGYEQDEIYQMAENLGLDGFIVKPVTSSTLLDVITDSYSAERQIGKVNKPGQNPADISAIRGAAILLVEDNEINREVAREILESEGFNVDTAINGEEAYRILNRSAAGKYNLVLMDLQMPVMSGYEAAKLIRNKITHKDLPLIAMTADMAHDTKAKAEESGMNGLISKPIDTSELFKCLLKFIKPSAANKRVYYSGYNFPDKTVPGDISMTISGLDHKKGMNTISGNSRLYRKLLLQFSESYLNKDSYLLEMYKKGDTAALNEFLHTLTGVAGNLGFSKIPDLSRQISAALKLDEKNRIDSLIEELASTLQKTVEELLRSDYIRNISEMPDDENKDSIIRGMIELKKLLDSDHGEALILIESILDLYSKTAYADDIKKIYAAINFFDIDSAKQLIDRFLEES